jgi:hypothetical protein
MTWLAKSLMFVHVLFAFLFMLAHGASAVVAFRLPHERSVERLRALLELSWSTVGLSYQALVIVIVAGVALGFIEHRWSAWWIWISLGTLVLLSAFMVLTAARFSHRVREAVGLPFHSGPGERPVTDPLPDDAIARVIASGHPRVVAIVGVVGWSLILWLMLVKPF